MRGIIVFLLLIAVLCGLIIARANLPEPAVPALAEGPPAEYNSLDPVFPGATETAGDGMIGEMSAYCLSLEPTAKNVWTGALEGRHLLLVCADGWTPDLSDREQNPALYRLARESAQLGQVYRPDWFQGLDGRLFALLTGLEPTRVNDGTALAHTEAQDILLPYSLPRSFLRDGGEALALLPDDTYVSAMEALDFVTARAAGDPVSCAAAALAALAEAEAPTLVFCLWEGNGEAALSLLMDALSEERRTDTALCLLTADADPERAQMYLWGAGLSGAASDAPCSELDVVPTFLNLFGMRFDSRLLSGRDVFAPNGVPLVTLYGSAFSAWVTDAGCYDPVSDIWTDAGREADAEYIRTVCTLNYQRYIFARRVMEMDYFRLLKE